MRKKEKIFLIQEVIVEYDNPQARREVIIELKRRPDIKSVTALNYGYYKNGKARVKTKLDPI